jgi:Tfp pilus assembly protein PilX
MHTMKLPPHRPSLPGRQQGIVLVIALILLGIVGITSAMAIRSALEGDTIATSLRSVNLTNQAAETALRWCELQARNADVSPAASAAPLQQPLDDSQFPSRWSTLAGFTANAVQVPAAVMTAAGMTNLPTLPQCIVENNTAMQQILDGNGYSTGSRSYVVTVRAFSPDYNRAGANKVGNEVWLQSNLILSN